MDKRGGKTRKLSIGGSIGGWVISLNKERTCSTVHLRRGENWEGTKLFGVRHQQETVGGGPP